MEENESSVRDGTRDHAYYALRNNLAAFGQCAETLSAIEFKSNKPIWSVSKNFKTGQHGGLSHGCYSLFSSRCTVRMDNRGDRKLRLKYAVWTADGGQWLRALSAKPGDLSSISRTRTAEGEN